MLLLEAKQWLEEVAWKELVGIVIGIWDEE